MNKKQLKMVLEMLEREKFAQWYNTGRFASYIGDGKALNITEDDILADLKKMLGA